MSSGNVDSVYRSRLEPWRARSGAGVERWISALGELEALLELSTYSYEHSGDRFPVLIEGGPLLEGEGLGHPLISERRLVRGLVERGALGLITTHDPALSKVADSLAPAAANLHFEDHLEDRKLLSITGCVPASFKGVTRSISCAR